MYSWILSRTRQLPASAQIEVNQVIDSIIDLNNAYYEETDRTDEGCFYFPVPSPDEIVEFRNPCDETIPAVSNFNISAVRIFSYLPYVLCMEVAASSMQLSPVVNVWKHTAKNNFIVTLLVTN